MPSKPHVMCSIELYIVNVFSCFYMLQGQSPVEVLPGRDAYPAFIECFRGHCEGEVSGEFCKAGPPKTQGEEESSATLMQDIAEGKPTANEKSQGWARSS